MWSSSSVRATAEPQAGRLPPGQGSSSVWPNPWARSPWLTVCARSQSSRPSFCELGDRARREAVAAGLVAGEDRRVGDQHLEAQPRRPGRRRRPRGPGADDEHVGLHGHVRGHRAILSGDARRRNPGHQPVTLTRRSSAGANVGWSPSRRAPPIPRRAAGTAAERASPLSSSGANAVGAGRRPERHLAPLGQLGVGHPPRPAR